MDEKELSSIVSRVRIMQGSDGFSKILTDDFNKLISEILRLREESSNA